ncbi:hypothetical protein Pla100_47430 [Neorhodopirellula pilleata]|uniref:Alpha/beta-hydrolase family protein n=2 Tax=Neorhodopirellula pilleata TaxID=2714738 RepID=A0A5C5ZYE7_9BACT|nr:hypothetical protein Pla100_47430 [Neorhodopirellula pilleata]
MIQYGRSFSFVGLVVGMFFFAASVTPSLLPRHFVTQGLLSGFAIAAGYAVGFAAVGVYLLAGFRQPPPKIQTISRWTSGVIVAITFMAFLWRMTFWQNSIRELMEMPDLETAYPFRVALIAILWAGLLIAAARWFLVACQWVSAKLERFFPRRFSIALGFSLVAFTAMVFANDVVVRSLLDAADSFFAQADELVDDGMDPPADSSMCGSDASLVSWETIGYQGKSFLTTGPTSEAVSQFWGKPTPPAVRVYVGMRSRPTMRERAELALEELKRAGGFDKSVLVVATPTGTGWLDPSAVDPLEYLHGGDCAIVSMQYSYLPSWITIVVDPRRSIESGLALFDAVYDYWKTLPASDRPRLYLHGLSLGSLGSERSADLFKIFEDPIHGSVWSGPPFPSQKWRSAIASRNPDSPSWLPTFRDGRLLRFTGESNSLEPDRPWGPMRNVYIQHASDPMVWFSPDLAWTRPDWLNDPRGPDVSPHLRWYPIVTFLQAAFDIPMATTVPIGFGHNYAPASYIHAWIAVTQPKDWTNEMTTRLQSDFQARATPKP